MRSFFGRRNDGPRDADTARADATGPLYTIRPDDERLLRAAIALGDWILARDGTTRRQKDAVKRLQDALRELPGTPPPIIAEYGFHVRYETALDGRGLYRAWRVALSPSGIEIYSVYSPDEGIDFEDKVARELNFWQRPHRPASSDGTYFDEWIEEVSDPDRFMEGSAMFGVMAEFEMSEYSS